MFLRLPSLKMLSSLSQVSLSFVYICLPIMVHKSSFHTNKTEHIHLFIKRKKKKKATESTQKITMYCFIFLYLLHFCPIQLLLSKERGVWWYGN